MARYRNLIIVAIVALVIAVGTPAFSAKPVPTPKVIIQSVTVDLQLNRLQISGENFGISPAVTLAGTVLAVISSNGTQILASLTSPPPAVGTYKLSVANGSQSGEFYVSIGAMGGVGNLGVYDGSGLFLGILINADKSGYRVFNPDIPAFLYLSTKQNPPVFESSSYLPSSGHPCWYDRFAFTTNTCIDQLYVQTTRLIDGVEWGCGLQDLIYNFHSGKYYIRDTSLPILKYSDLNAIYWNTSGNWQTCRTDMASFPATPDDTAFPVKEILIPELLTTPLIYPITIQSIQ